MGPLRLNRAPQLNFRGAEIGGNFSPLADSPKKASGWAWGRRSPRGACPIGGMAISAPAASERRAFAWGPGEAAAPSKSRGVGSETRRGRARANADGIGFRSLGGGPAAVRPGVVVGGEDRPAGFDDIRRTQRVREG